MFQRSAGTSLSPPYITLDSLELHLWLTFYDELAGEQLRATYRAVLNYAENEQESRFYFEKDRWRYVVTRALVRTVLSRYAPLAPKDWTFLTNRYGRPEIANTEATKDGLTFNISHTDSLIVLGITKHRALGIDVENIHRRKVSIKIAEQFFAWNELAELARIPLHRWQDRFFEYWTFKESYIKARGMGLSLPLDKCSFYFPHDRCVKIAIHPKLADDAVRWHFWQFRPRREYLVAVCAECVDTRAPLLVIRKIVPARSEELLVTEILRTSD
jgi:4'-phosphopantetheinyl transferase